MRSLIPPNLRKLRFVGIRDDRLLVGHWRKKRRFATTFYLWMYFTRESPLLPPHNQLYTCHPELKPRAKRRGSEGSHFLFLQSTLIEMWCKISFKRRGGRTILIIIQYKCLYRPGWLIGYLNSGSFILKSFLSLFLQIQVPEIPTCFQT